MMGADQQRLRFIIRNTADSHVAVHGICLFIKFCTERGVFDVVDCPVKAFLFIICHHAGTPCSKVTMIVCTKEQIKDTVAFGSDSKETSHSKPPVVEYPIRLSECCCGLMKTNDISITKNRVLHKKNRRKNKIKKLKKVIDIFDERW